MRILQVHARYRQTGGEDTVVAAEAELLRSAGHQIIQVHQENPAGTIRAAGALALAAWNPWSARAIAAIVSEHRPDLVHVHNTWFALSPSVLHAVRAWDMPVVMTLHNYRLLCSNAQLFRDGAPCEDCVGSHPWHGVVHRCYRNSVTASLAAAGTIALHHARGTWERDVDLFLALNDFSKDRFVAGGLPAEKILVKPNFVPDPGPRRLPPSASKSVLFVGRLSTEKGIELLLQAWAEADNADLELLVIGDGPMRAALEARAPAGVRFFGRLAPEDVRRIMLEARALVFPSISYETQGMVVLEGLAAGLPVLASDLGTMPETLSDLGPQWLAPPRLSKAWSRALEGLRSPEVVDAASPEARSLYERRFSPVAGLAGLEAAYRTVL